MSNTVHYLKLRKTFCDESSGYMEYLCIKACLDLRDVGAWLRR